MYPACEKPYITISDFTDKTVLTAGGYKQLVILVIDYGSLVCIILYCTNLVVNVKTIFVSCNKPGSLVSNFLFYNPLIVLTSNTKALTV